MKGSSDEFKERIAVVISGTPDYESEKPLGVKKLESSTSINQALRRDEVLVSLWWYCFFVWWSCTSSGNRRKTKIIPVFRRSINRGSNNGEVMICGKAFPVSFLSWGFGLQYFSWKLHGYGSIRNINVFAWALAEFCFWGFRFRIRGGVLLINWVSGRLICSAK